MGGFLTISLNIKLALKGAGKLLEGLKNENKISVGLGPINRLK